MVVSLILAAGESSRMGSPKALLPWENTTVLAHVLTQVRRAGFEDTIVVSGAHHEQIRQMEGLDGAHVCFNASWAGGIGSSIGRGVQCALDRYPQMEGVLLVLADQPLIRPDYLEQLASRYQAGPETIIATKYPEGPGVPAIFDQKYFGALQSLPPDKGARGLIGAKPGETALLDAGPGNRDMDTPEAYRELKRIAGLTDKINSSDE